MKAKMDDKQPTTPELRDIFYALVLAEIQAQPSLKGALGDNDLKTVVTRAFGEELETFIRRASTSDATLAGAGFGVVKELAPPSRNPFKNSAKLIAAALWSNYESQCRAALLHLFWGELDKAERKINIAKLKYDERAFAHHMYGLLRGLQGIAPGARFELHLALEREQLEGPRLRVEQALRILDRF